MAITLVSSGSTTGTSINLACSGVSRFLVAIVGGVGISGSNVVTYGGTPLTKGQGGYSSGNWLQIYYMFRPPVGTYSLVTNFVGNGFVGACFDEVSFSSGVITSGSIYNDTGGSISLTLSGIQSGDCMVGGIWSRYGFLSSLTAGTSFARVSNNLNGVYRISSGTSTNIASNYSTDPSDYTAAAMAVRYGIEPELMQTSLLTPMWFIG